MTRRHTRLRATALLAAGALLVHELRYLIADPEPGLPLGAGHAYLAQLAPLVALALAAAAAQLVARLVRPSAESPLPSFPRLWVAAAGSLALMHAAQETAEGLLSPGNAAGLSGLVGLSGAVALALALAVGALVALLLRGARALVELAARARRSAPRPRSARSLALPARVALPALDVLARGLAARAPPLASV
jgi:hypothetical protein